MAKKQGFPQLKNWIKRKQPGPTPPVKTRLNPQAVVQEDKPSFLWDEDSPEEGLEDTPVAPMYQPITPVNPIETPAVSAGRVEIPAARVESAPEAGPPVYRAAGKHYSAVSRGSVLSSATHGVAHLLTGASKKSKGNAAALEFAENHKRLGRKGRRNRRILIYAGSALAVAAALLLVFLVPGGAAAPVDARTSESSASVSAAIISVSPDTTGSSGVKGSAIKESTGETPTATAVPTPTPSPSPSPTPIATTAPDPTENPIDLDELAEFYVVEADKYYNDMGYSSNYYDYTEDDVYVLAQLIYGEARGETTEGKIAVANVVMNRVLCRGAWGNTIKSVVTAPGQFSGYNSSSHPNRACISVARRVLQYQVWVIPQDIYYFRSGAPANVDWGSHKFYTKIGGHCFYRHKYYGRMRGGGVPPALFERTYRHAQYGCKPEDRVYRIQYMLRTLGYDVEKPDSYFGKGTKDALIEFQQDHGLEDDGVCGPATIRKLIEEFGLRDYYIKFCT